MRISLLDDLASCWLFARDYSARPSLPSSSGSRVRTFVSLLSAHGVPVEAIALLAGHNQTSTTELVYRHQIVPALTRGAEVMDEIFG